MSTDRHWERWGKLSPYYGVLADERFRTITPETKREFFESGEKYVTELLTKISAPKRALDFGCGTGRICLPLSRRCEVVGVDISPSMLEEARRNVPAATFVLGDDVLSRVSGDFDLVHSAIVFQHIPVKRGMRLTELLLALVAPGGYAVLHYPFYREAGTVRKVANWTRHHIPGVHKLLNVAQGKPISDPPMQMNCYDLGKLAVTFLRAGFEIERAEYAKHTGYYSVILYGVKR